MAAVLALLAAATIVAVVVLSGGNDGRGGQGAAAAQAKGKGQAKSGKQAHPAETTAAEAPAVVPTGTDPARGAELNEQGYAMVQAGEYEAAVPVLEEAVRSFPEGSEDLDYAYALFNLGDALRLSGRPEDAIPVLEQRLQIPNQTGTVEQELERARAEAGQTGEGEEGD
jgi:tetratricopeptide (TPR) repeat protein